MQDHECYKKRNKTRPLHCNVCLKLLSNSWSLNRHMKIHRTNDDKPLPPLNSSEDASDIKSFENDSTNGNNESDTNIVIAVQSDSSMTIGNNGQIMAPVKPKPPGKRLEEPMECIVCRRPFKNPNALEKHLRFVHTVYTKDPNRPDYKKYVQEARNKSTLTNNTAPIKPSIAKALASKLTKKKNIMNQEEASLKTEEQQTQFVDIQQTTDDNMLNKRDNNTIIIISNVELTNGNMFDAQQLLNQQTTNPIGVQILNNTDKLPKLVPISNNNTNSDGNQPLYEDLSPPPPLPPPQQVTCNGDVITPNTPVDIIDMPKMIVLKKSKKNDGVPAGHGGNKDAFNEVIHDIFLL